MAPPTRTRPIKRDGFLNGDPTSPISVALWDASPLSKAAMYGAAVVASNVSVASKYTTIAQMHQYIHHAPSTNKHLQLTYLPPFATAVYNNRPTLNVNSYSFLTPPDDVTLAELSANNHDAAINNDTPEDGTYTAALSQLTLVSWT